jgi:hypothetical protein
MLGKRRLNFSNVAIKERSIFPENKSYPIDIIEHANSLIGKFNAF